MGLSYDRRPAAPAVEDLPGFCVFDVIEMREGIGLEHAPGVVVILDHLRPDDPDEYIGKRIHITNPSGRSFDATVEAVRDHRASISFFLRGLSKTDVPIGSRVEIGE